MRKVALLALICISTSGSAFTITTRNGGLTLVVCDDVVFTLYRKPEGGIIHGIQVSQGVFVLTCPRTNAPWHLIINGCAAPKVSTVSSGNYQLSC